jgi:hypothetical protein
MVEIALIVLKFAALITGGIFAAIGLLTDYRDKEGKVTKWGKIALFGIVLSTVIGAGTQAVETYRDREAGLKNDAANRKSEEQTQKVLGELRRAIYPLRSVALQRLWILYPASNSLIAKDLRSRSPSNDGGDFVLSRESSKYPRNGFLLEVIEPFLQVGIWRKGADAQKNAPDLKFEMQFKPELIEVDGDTLVVMLDRVLIPDASLTLSQGMASLEDIRDGEIHVRVFMISSTNDKFNALLNELYQKTQLTGFSLLIANHEIKAELKPQGPHQFLFVGKLSMP